MAVRLLGPLRLFAAGDEIALGGAAPRSLLAVLAIRAGTVVTMAELVAALWGDRAPKAATGSVYTYVSQIRKALAPGEPRTARAGLLTSSRAGYCLRIPAESVDLLRFDTAATRARARWAMGDPAGTLEACDAALAEWGGTPLGGASGPFVDAERSRLELAALDTRELRCAALLEAGSAVDAAVELGTLAQRHPLRERLHELLMLALYRSGRQAEALEVYQKARQRLVEELGIEPGPALRRMHQLVLDASEVLETSAPATQHSASGGSAPRRPASVVPAQLPHGVAPFIGRADELRQLEKLCASAADARALSVVISTVEGVGGIGKTALAIQAAHLLSGDFPDGQLFIDLRGFDLHLPPVTPDTALRHLLRGLGADLEHFPDGDIDAAAALYRSLLAGRRVLVVLDNASSAEQVRPLLPGSPGCLALVTSRDRLSGLTVRDGAVRMSLGVLRPEESMELLRASLGTQIVDGAPEEARELAALCGHLPLALRIAAERVADSGHCTLADMVLQLRAEHSRLDALSLGDDESVAVRAVFSWSYHLLKPGPARTFRLLGLFPGAQFGIEQASALLGCPVAQARARLDGLVGRHLVDQIDRDRYRLHDLIRIYAAERAEADEPADETLAATERLLRWSLASAAAVRDVLTPQFGRLPRGEADPASALEVPPLRVRTYAEALSWTDHELSTLAGILQSAVDRGLDTIGAQLACMMGSLCYCSGRWAQWLQVIECGQAAARRAHDELSLALLHNDRGVACDLLGRRDEAVASHQAALDILSGFSEPRDQVVTTNLALAYAMTGRLRHALAPLENALRISREQGNAFLEGIVTHHLGALLSSLGRHDEAIEDGRRAVALFRRTGAEITLAHALIQLGESCVRAGRIQEALTYYGYALKLWRARGDVWGETTTMMALAAVRQRVGDRPGARALLHDALAIMRDTGRLAVYGREVADIEAQLSELGDGDGD